MIKKRNDGNGWYKATLTVEDLIKKLQNYNPKAKVKIHMEKVRELHFYTNLSDIEQTSDWDLETMCTDYVSTIKAIDDSDERVVKTTQLTFLNDAWYYIDNGFEVYIHISDNVIEVKEHMTGINGKDIRYGHNICKILCSGGLGKIK